MSAVKIKIPEDNITTFLTMRSHFKKIYDVQPRVNCWSEACPSKQSLKHTINIRDFRVLPHYCNSTISSAAKKLKKQNYEECKLTRPSSSKKKHLSRNLSCDSPYNDDAFGFESEENNSRAYTPEDHHRNRGDVSNAISRQHHSPSSEHPKEMAKKKDKFFQNTMDEPYQRFLEEMTNEIVRLDLCTDKALNNVFRKHIKHNIGKLDEKKMIKEVKKVRVLLDLSSDTEDRYSRFDVIPSISMSNEFIQHDMQLR